MNHQENRFASAAEHAQALTTAVSTQLAQAVLNNGSAVLAVSGGRSPIAFFTALSQANLPWENITVTLVDERIVPTDHADSNTRLVREHLLQNRAASARFHGLMPDGDTTKNGISDAQLLTNANEQFLPSDVVVLGMGEDGHTASLFPHVADLSATAPVLRVQPTTAPYARLSLSLQSIIHAPQVFLAIGGSAKIAVYEQAKRAANTDLPISFVLQHNPRPTQVFIHD